MSPKHFCSTDVLMTSDQEESSDFVISSPDRQPGLVPEIERGAVPKEYLNRYYADHDVRCAFCVTHQLHKRGFTVKMADGRIALCGIDCAKVFFGEEVAAHFEQELDKQISRKALQDVLARTVSGAPTALRVLDEEWIDLESDLFSAATAVQKRTRLSDLSRDITDGSLVLKKVRATWVTATGRDGSTYKKREYVEDVLGRAPGAACLSVRRKELAWARGGLVALQGWSSKPQLIDAGKSDELAAKRRAVMTSLNDGVQFVRAALRFFTPESVKVFNAWHRGRHGSDGHPVIAIDARGTITIQPGDAKGLPTIVHLPARFPDPSQLLGPLTSAKGS